MSRSNGVAGTAQRSSDFLVVGLGGSAGSIPSFREFFRNVPPDSGMAYVVILHLSPEHESQLAEVLQGSAAIQVTQVRESVTIEPNHVYVIPPSKNLSVSHATLVVSDVSGFEERRAPIDIFFRTLADTHEARAVCVIMSGSGSDGSMGLRRVKEYNGLVLVQDPTTAEFGEMPRNAIATGLVDYVLPVAQMPAKIIGFRDKLGSPALDFASHMEDEQALMEIFTQLRMRTGHDFTNYKRATVLRRLERRLAVREIAALPEYARFLQAHPEEAESLLRELLISVTNFFRDRAVWERVQQTIVPALLRGKNAGDHVRVWVPGCATGEEAYTVAMLLADAAADMPSAPDIQIFATDLDEDAITKARNGFYSVADTADVAPEQLRRHFIKEQDGYRVRRELHELILFAHHNLIKDPPFSHLDFVSCRNVLIYLNRTAQQRAMEVLHFSLEPGGYLLLGTAESVDGAGQLFSTVDKEYHVYQSRAVPRVVTTPAPAQLTVAADIRHSAGTAAEQRAENRGLRFAPLDIHQRLLEEYAAPSLVTDEQQNVVHLSERAGRYLQIPAGEPSLNVLQIVRPELRMDLRAALYQAAQKRTIVVARNIAVNTGERTETIDLIVRPALRESDPVRGYFLVLFEESRETIEPGPAAAAAVEPAARQIEEELVRLKAQMRLTVEQYEVQAEEAKAANEELQAINEELRSTAEELETSQEELQSVNEELQTVNQELKVKIDEISHANNDMRNLMSSTEIGTIFVDRALCVKLFTPRARDIFNLIPADVGRPLLDITSKLAAPDLAHDLERVLDRLQTVEREVQTRDGRWHLMRFLPYRTAEDRIDGVVVTFLDVTERKSADEALRRASEQLEQLIAARTAELREASVILQSVINASPLAIVSVDRERKVRTWNVAAQMIFREPVQEAVGRELAAGTDELHDAVRALLDAVFAGGPSPQRREGRYRYKDGTPVDVSMVAAPLKDMDGSISAAMVLVQDETERKALAREREHLLRRIVESQEEERQRIARELHDELGQHLTALKVGLEGLRPANDAVEQMKGIVSRIDQSIDRLTLELRPAILDDVGLQDAVSSLLDQFRRMSGIRVDVHTTGTDGTRIPAPIETTLYRVLQEALTNVWKHARAKSVSVIIERQPDQVQLIVEDDGSGFDTDDGGDMSRGQFGLLGIRERVSLIGGTFNIESAPGRGTTLFVRVPLSATHSE